MIYSNYHGCAIDEGGGVYGGGDGYGCWEGGYSDGDGYGDGANANGGANTSGAGCGYGDVENGCENMRYCPMIPSEVEP